MANQLSSKKQRKYIKEIKRLAAQLPPMEGYDHLMNMLGLFQLHGPDGVKGYIIAIDKTLKKIEDMQIVINEDNTIINGIAYSKADRLDLPTLQAKVAIHSGIAAAVDPLEEFTPESVAESVNHAEAEKETVSDNG